MIEVRPDFYARFACRAAHCRHSCCRGWEIDVDDASAAYYRALPGDLGNALRAALSEDMEGWHFRLDAEERCPFLRRDGLCRLICELGEDALCDICALHPRFYAACGEYELAGLGLSCEAVSALLLETDAPLSFIAEDEILTLPALLTRLGAACADEELRFIPQVSHKEYTALLAAFARTEPIDAAWMEELAELSREPEAVLAAARGYAGRYDRARYDRILGYILYRQLERLEDCGLPTLLDYARRCTTFIFLQSARDGDTAEHLRRWSEQIEYSTENVDILLEA